jgi:tetrahydromethanopterin S-methyltransferase subunit B
MADTIDVKDANGDVLPVATNDAIVASVNAVKTSVDTLDGSVDAVKTSVDAVKTSVDTLDGSVDAVKGSVDAGNALLTAQAFMIDGLEALLTAVSASLTTANNRAVAQLGARTVVQSPAVNIATDQPAIPVNQVSAAADVSQSFTRQNNVTAYAAGAVVGAAAAVLQFTGLGKAGGASLMIVSAQLRADVTTAPATAFKLHLYSSAPTSTPVDAAAFDVPSTEGAYLGWIDIPAPSDLGSIAFSQVSNIGMQVKATGADIFGVLQAVSAFTPTALAVYKISLHRVEV